MQFSFLWGIVVTCGSLATARVAELDSRQQPTDSKPVEPCAQVAAISVPLKKANPKGPSPQVSGQLAFDCLNSVPLHKQEALGVAGSILPYARWQSDLEFKKNPPPGYPMPAVDLIGSLTRIVDNLTANVYPNEYAWQADTFRTFNTAKDGHFRFAGDLLVNVVRFQRNVGLVSVSLDGVGLPQIYMLDDINKTQGLGQSFTPSVVTQINGKEAVSFMEDEADLGFQQDADAAYNTMFFSPALNGFPGTPFQYGNFGGDQRAGFIWPGPNTTISLANGSTLVIPTMARVVGNLTGVVDGESLYQKFCVPPPPQNFTDQQPPIPPFTGLNTTVQIPFYPKPQVAASDASISAYYLPSHSDVGVIAMPGFNPMIPSEFQAVMQTMLAEMQRDGKDKLIVDLSVNGGGSILQGFDAFRQLFPTTQDQSMARYRIHDGLMEAAQAVRAILPENFDPNTASFAQLNLYETHYNFKLDRSLAGTHFFSLPDKFTGLSIGQANYSNLFQWDFNDQLLTVNNSIGLGMEITGYGTRANFTQPFKAENIVMLYDGQCASTCTLFSELMRQQGGVKSIAMGGRPSSSQIQAVGGVKGSSDNTYDDLFSITDYLVKNKPQNLSVPNLAALTNLPQSRSADNSINMLDHILPENFKDGIPAQFIVEPADCRIFYTPAMITDITKMWDAAAEAAFNGKACVVGGISAGMSMKRESLALQRRKELLRRAEMPKLRSKAAAARKLLAQARAKGPVQKVKNWDAIHGKAIPPLHAY